VSADSRASTRLWLTCCAAVGLLCAVLFAVATSGWLGSLPTAIDHILVAFVLPGTLASIFFGGSVHGGGFGDWRDYAFIFLVSGLLWGSVLFGLARLVRLLRRRPAV